MRLLPSSILHDLQGVPGFDEQAFVAVHETAAPVSVRINPRKDIGLFATNERTPWCPAGVYLPERPVFTLDPAFHAGAYYVQEASSMFLHHMLASLLPSNEELRVLDLCAAPGGKSTLLASLLHERSLLVSNEVIRTRASILEENMTRWGYSNTWVTSNDPRDFGRVPGYFDVIVVDAPCSGSGLWRKDEKALDEWSEANVQLCGERQQRILADIWPALKEDGLLIYATCSYSPQEDEEILDWLATTYEVESLPVTIPAEWGIVATTTGKDMTGYRFFPHRVKGEGFFIAALRKKEDAATQRAPRFKTAHDKKAFAQVAHMLQNRDMTIVATGKEEYSAVMPAHEPDIQLLKSAVYLRRIGLPLGQPVPKEWLPAHDLALSINASQDIARIGVSREQALRFLKREDMELAESSKGWYIVTYDGLGLGWIKSLGNRVNNYLPKHWRIRMDIE